MKLDNLKPAWQQFRLMNALQPIQEKEILSIIEQADPVAVTKSYRILINTALFIALIIFCQGG